MKIQGGTSFLFSALLCISSLPSAVSDILLPEYPTAYCTYFSDAECTQFAGMKGFAANQTVEVVKAMENMNGNAISCVDGMVCLLQPNSTQCENLQVSGEVATATFDIRNSDIYECDDSNANVGQFDCASISPNQCTQSSAFSCYFKLTTFEDLKKDPESIIPPNSSNLDGLDQYAYLTYYEDEDASHYDCTDLAGIRGFVSDNDYSIPSQASDDTHINTCAAAMPCFLQPGSLLCQDEVALTGPMANGNIEVLNATHVRECDDSNMANQEPECALIGPEECRDSSIYSHCHFHWQSATILARDPASVLAPEATSMAPSMAPSMDTSGATEMRATASLLVSVIVGTLALVPWN